MIRLTLLLIACMGVTLAIAGRHPNLPEGSDQPQDIEVARLDVTDSDALLQPDTTQQERNAAIAIPLHDRQAAIEAALHATENGHVPAPVAPAPVAVTLDSTLPPAPSADAWYVTGNRVNLRQGPSTATSVIGQASFGQQARVIEEMSNGWFHIEIADGSTTGFIYGQFLSRQAPL